MKSRRFSQGFVASTLFSGLALATACGGSDDDDSGSYEASCDAACDRIHECDSNQDVQTCGNTCRNDAADIGPKLSAEYLVGIDACIQELSCNELAASAFLNANTCGDEARARIAPSNTVTSLCEDAAASADECGGLSDTASCIDNVKIFNSSALAEARTCFDKPCDQRGSCFLAALAIQL